MADLVRNMDDLELYRSKDISTRQLNPVNSQLLRLKYPKASRVLNGPCIMLYLPDGAEPLELWNIAVVTLGRADSYSKTIPTVDLTEHHGKLLGVSRLHAQIFYRDNHYYLKDLGSTNGTWVNNIKIDPSEEVRLANEDSVRLGHLMIQIGGC